MQSALGSLEHGRRGSGQYGPTAPAESNDGAGNDGFSGFAGVFG